MKTMIIGIAGGTGSGKTTLTEHLAAHFGANISVVHHDNYYKRQNVPFAERCKQNYDHPDAFDTDLMVQQLRELKDGHAIRCPVYSYSDHNRTDETVLIQPAPVIIVEGILIFQDPRLRELMDIRIFVETDADVRILAGPCGTWKSGAAPCSRWCSSISPPSSPCTSSSWSPPGNMLISLCWRVATTW